jgi:hypothetical protein
MRSKGELSTTLAIAVTVSFWLLLDRVDVGFIEWVENFELEFAETLWPTVLGLPSVFFGRAKVLVDKNCFPVSLSKLGYPTKKGKATKLEVFKGREAKLNLAIFYVFSKKESPLAVWNILGFVSDCRGFKRVKFAVVNERVKALESQGYLRGVGVRDTKQGGECVLYELTVRAELALALYFESMDTILGELDDSALLTVLSVIVSRQNRQI